jgi:putative CocE/NonD family hydrolase
MRPSARLLTIISYAFLMSPYLCFSEEPYPENPKTFVEMRWGTKIAVRDGVRLNAAIYVCADKESTNAVKTPAIVLLTPYVSDSYHAVADYFAHRGYSFAVVDCRGRGNSAGKFDPFVNDAKDAYDVIEWVAKQDWCDGKVAMWGGSYSGTNQWLAAKELPPHLLTIAPVASTRIGINGHIYRAVPAPYLTQWLTLVSGTTAQENMWKDDNFWTQTFYSAYKNLVRFRELDSFVGNPSEIFQRWVAQQPTDAFWTSVSPISDEISKIAIPILSITGQYDADQLGTLTLIKNTFDMEGVLPRIKTIW